MSCFGVEHFGIVVAGSLSTLSVCICSGANLLHGVKRCCSAKEDLGDSDSEDHEVRSIAHKIRCTKNGHCLGTGTIKFDGEVIELPFLPSNVNSVAVGNMFVRLEGKSVELRPKQPFVQEFTMEFPESSEAKAWTRTLGCAATEMNSNEHTRIMELRNLVKQQEITIKSLSHRYRALCKQMKKKESSSVDVLLKKHNVTALKLVKNEEEEWEPIEKEESFLQRARHSIVATEQGLAGLLHKDSARTASSDTTSVDPSPRRSVSMSAAKHGLASLMHLDSKESSPTSKEPQSETRFAVTSQPPAPLAPEPPPPRAAAVSPRDAPRKDGLPTSFGYGLATRGPSKAIPEYDEERTQPPPAPDSNSNGLHSRFAAIESHLEAAVGSLKKQNADLQNKADEMSTGRSAYDSKDSSTENPTYDSKAVPKGRVPPFVSPRSRLESLDFSSRLQRSDDSEGDYGSSTRSVSPATNKYQTGSYQTGAGEGGGIQTLRLMSSNNSPESGVFGEAPEKVGLAQRLEKLTSESDRYPSLSPSNSASDLGAERTSLMSRMEKLGLTAKEKVDALEKQQNVSPLGSLGSGPKVAQYVPPSSRPKLEMSDRQSSQRIEDLDKKIDKIGSSLSPSSSLNSFNTPSLGTTLGSMVSVPDRAAPLPSLTQKLELLNKHSERSVGQTSDAMSILMRRNERSSTPSDSGSKLTGTSFDRKFSPMSDRSASQYSAWDSDSNRESIRNSGISDSSQKIPKHPPTVDPRMAELKGWMVSRRNPTM